MIACWLCGSLGLTDVWRDAPRARADDAAGNAALTGYPDEALPAAEEWDETRATNATPLRAAARAELERADCYRTWKRSGQQPQRFHA